MQAHDCFFEEMARWPALGNKLARLSSLSVGNDSSALLFTPLGPFAAALREAVIMNNKKAYFNIMSMLS